MSSRNIMILHSPKNFGGTRTHPHNKVICMLGPGSQAICILLDLNMAFIDLNIVVPLVQDLTGCNSAEEVANIPAPEENRLVGFEGSAIFIPGLVLQNTILTSNTKNPFELITIISNKARSFYMEHEYKATTITHADDLNAWLYGMKTGLVPETRYSVNPDNTELQNFAWTDTCNASLQMQQQWQATKQEH
jgi:hypothetical protein